MAKAVTAAIGGLMKPLVHGKERAQGLVEYALILLFVSIVLVFALTLLGGGIYNVYSNIIGAI